MGSAFDHSSSLEKLDALGYTVIDALTVGQCPPTNSLANPHSFVCSDGKEYWVKKESQHGLVAELVAGRLGHKLGVAPETAVVNVFPALVANHVDAIHLTGILVGSRNMSNTVNAKHLAPAQLGPLGPGLIDEGSRARVVVFQTWLGVGDPQVLIGLSTGKVTSIDHGCCFGDVAAQPDATLVITPIPGLKDDFGSKSAVIDEFIGKIEALNEHDILATLSNMPADEKDWKTTVQGRLAIGKWLFERIPTLRKAVKSWA